MRQLQLALAKILSIVCCFGLLVGCGQTGPLYLPKQPNQPNVQKTTPSTPANTNRDQETKVG